jgi:hypothetical protein
MQSLRRQDIEPKRRTHIVQHYFRSLIRSRGIYSIAIAATRLIEKKALDHLVIQEPVFTVRRVSDLFFPQVFQPPEHVTEQFTLLHGVV